MNLYIIPDQKISLINQIDAGMNTYIEQYKQTEITEKGELDMSEGDIKPSKNQILYGPPGTGKTYNTVVEAMKIIGLPDNKPEYIKEDVDYENLKSKIVKYSNNYDDKEYKALKQAFDYYKSPEQGRIEFITFHQSYSYEEFVEGIKPYILKWGKENTQDVKYVGQNGIFKEICHNAEHAKEDIEYSYNKCIEEYKNTDKIIECVTPVNGKTQATKFGLKINSNNGWDILTGESLEDKGVGSLTLNNLKDIENMTGRDCYAKGFKKYLIDTYRPPYVLIIDEINRGNISKIFGELITLIEEDKRKNVTGETKEYHTLEVKLPYSNEPFTVPNNLYIIGTMNTADKSLALLDAALRRRFEFVPMYPKREGFKHSEILNALNDEILKRKKSADYLIGHSYFMCDDTLENIFNHKVIPLLMEYFNGKIKEVKGILEKVFEITLDDKYQYINDKNEKDYYYLQVEKINRKKSEQKDENSEG